MKGAALSLPGGVCGLAGVGQANRGECRWQWGPLLLPSVHPFTWALKRRKGSQTGKSTQSFWGKWSPQLWKSSFQREECVEINAKTNF